MIRWLVQMVTQVIISASGNSRYHVVSDSDVRCHRSWSGDSYRWSHRLSSARQGTADIMSCQTWTSGVSAHDQVTRTDGHTGYHQRVREQQISCRVRLGRQVSALMIRWLVQMVTQVIISASGNSRYHVVSDSDVRCHRSWSGDSYRWSHRLASARQGTADIMSCQTRTSGVIAHDQVTRTDGHTGYHQRVREQQISCRVRLGRQVSALMIRWLVQMVTQVSISASGNSRYHVVSDSDVRCHRSWSGDSYRWSELPVVFMNILMWYFLTYSI